MIGLDGEKMSKSRGNLVFVSKLRGARVDPMAIRLALMDGHYRADREWTGGRLPQAEQRLARWRQAVALDRAPAAQSVLDGIRGCLAADLDTTGAIAVVDRWVDTALAHPGPDDEPGAGELVARTLDALLGIQ